MYMSPQVDLFKKREYQDGKFLVILYSGAQ